MHSHCRSNLVWILHRNLRKKTIAFCLDFLTAKFEWRAKKNKTGLHASLCDFYPLNWNEDQSKKILFDEIFDCGFIVRYMFCFTRYLTATFEWRPNKLEKKGISRLPCMGRTLNFPLRKAKSQWGDANYSWGDASLRQFKYWLYFHSNIIALFHYCNTAMVQNQHQLLTCQTSKWQSLLF